jgi:phosphoglycerate kinase
VNDAFATCHRDHSSISGIKIPVKAAGYLLKKEIDFFSKALENPVKPYLGLYNYLLRLFSFYIKKNKYF